jgi:hypothetical protein
MTVLLASFMLAVASAKVPESKASPMRTMPVARTPESSTIKLVIAVPKDGQIVGSPTWIQFRIDGFALGSGSQSDRVDEIVQTKMGQTVHVVIDDKPYFPINEQALDPFDEGGFYYDMSYKFEVPFDLSTGAHTVRMFPARSFGESLKGEKTFAAMTFYVGEKTKSKVDLSAPYITYNEPSNQMRLVEDKPILLDFYVNNAELSSDGYKVRLMIDGQTDRTITTWQPYYIYGLKKGNHTIKLELIDSKNKVVDGPFATASQKITVY